MSPTPADAAPGKSTPITFTAIDAKTGERSVVVDNFFAPMRLCRKRRDGGEVLRWLGSNDGDANPGN